MNYQAAHALDRSSEHQLGGVLFNGAYDNAVRALPGERFEHLFEQRAEATPHKLAIDSSEAQLTFAQLDARANQLARHLKSKGIGSGDRLALLFDKSIFSYIATLAILKLNAAYVPLDQSFPADRIAFICEDAACRAILTIARYREYLEPTGKTVLHLDDDQTAIDALPFHRLTADEKGAPQEDLAYIIYTSGSTGKPKGVPIDHGQIVNFIKVAVEVYGIRAEDRMYQGLTIAFDFAIEEIWVPLVVGATLVPGPTGARLLGKDLGDFLARENITALCCVPTLLATLEAELPELRYIMVSGEACPQDLVARWQKPGRIFLNAYGPTEATVTATLTSLEAGKPVTIGCPLPTYSIVILDPEKPNVLPLGDAGEIGIGGIGVARGYLNRDELTAKVFIPDFIGIPGNESARIYRTGDLGRINAAGEIEYMGRIDTQVKIRGYRIELTEIESVIMQDPKIAQAVVNKYEATPGAVELAAYYTLRPGVADFSLDAMVETLRQHVPSYMVPAYFQQLDVMPLLPSHKADRKKLPAPSGPRYSSRKGAVVAAETPLEIAIADAIRAVLKTDEVSIEDHFFDDMGANSLLMAQFCARLRDTGLVADVSMRDTYQHPTIRALATHLESAIAAEPVPVAEALAPHHAPFWKYALTGVGQIAVYLVYLTFTSWLFIETIDFVFEGNGPLELYLRAAGSSIVFTLALIAVPIALKWVLVGRWKAERFPIWSLKYFRLWLVKQLVRVNPMLLFNGTPLFNVYLRLLGAKIGKNAVIVNGGVPVITDLISIGEGTVVSKSVSISGYRARSGWIETGPVTIGARAFVGTASVLGIDTVIGDDAQLGNVSSLRSGQSIPAGARYHGSPALATTTNYDRSQPLPVNTLQRAVFNLVQVVFVYLVAIPLPTTVLLTLFPWIEHAGDAHLDGTDSVDIHWFDILWGSLVASGILYAVGMLLLLATTLIVPRVLGALIKPGVAYPLYGIRYVLFRTLFRTSNSATLNNFFGDSAYITGFLKALGWDLGTVHQTGSNFGSLQKQDVPSLTAVGTGTMVSDGLTMLNADVSATSFTVREARIGDNNYLGNALYYPAGGRTGDNVLLGTKVLVPLEGEILENTGLLGSPAFQIPRTVKRDNDIAEPRQGADYDRKVAAKKAANTRTMGLYLLSRWLLGFIGLAILGVAIAEMHAFGALALAAGSVATLVLAAIYTTFVERSTLNFGRLEPKIVSIYDPYYWWHENHWKVADTTFLSLFNGTPLKGWAWRLVGVRVGKRLFDDGASFSEKTLVELGDYVTLGEGAILQGHTMEDAAFKSDFIRLGNDLTVGSMAFMNYGVVMGDGSLLEPDSFLMKGEQVPAHSVWGGNPARQLRA